MNIITNHVTPGEPAHGLFEGPVDGRWLQRVWVIRGDSIAKYEVDMGPESDFEGVTPIVIPGFGDDSVAAVQYLADKNREDDYWAKRAAEMLEGSTLIADHVQQAEMDWEQVRNRSTFGSSISVQRNTYDPTAARRKLVAARQRTTGIISQRGRHD